MMNFLKNPIIIAVIAAGLTYGYMYLENEKKAEKNPHMEKQQVGYVTPIIIGILAGVIAYNYFGMGNSIDIAQVVQQTGGIQLVEANPVQNKVNISDRLTDTFDSKTYRLVGKNAIKLPQTDVFIDIAKF